ncbi:Hypothetical predicted protein, partial [Paramuricea clavata]
MQSKRLLPTYEAVFYFNTYLVNKLEQLLEQKSVSEKESEKEETKMEAMEDESETEDPAYEVEDAEVDSEAEEEEIEEESSGLLQVDGNLRTEPKRIVFLSQLLLLFNFCHCCKADNPLVEAKVLLGGGSYTKLWQIFLHMGLGCISHNTYFHYQRTVNFQPSIYTGKKYQAMLMEKAKQVKDGVVIAGDGRHGSMGHSAKFCAIYNFLLYVCTNHTFQSCTEIWKVLSKIAKEKDCEAVNEWIKPYSPLHKKVCTALTNTRLMKGIKKASPLAQTSCLEGFHSVLNHFAPKMIAYCYVGQYCRHILAVIHFNFNLRREMKRNDSDGSERVKISYPKFKNGEATVRNVRVAQNFAYIQEIYETFELSSKADLKGAAVKLKEMCPPPMNTMLSKQTKREALKKRSDRSQIVIQDVPPTTS